MADPPPPPLDGGGDPKRSIRDSKAIGAEKKGSVRDSKAGGPEKKGSVRESKAGGPEAKGSVRESKAGGPETKGSVRESKAGGPEAKGSVRESKAGGPETKGSVRDSKAGGEEKKGSVRASKTSQGASKGSIRASKISTKNKASTNEMGEPGTPAETAPPRGSQRKNRLSLAGEKLDQVDSLADHLAAIPEAVAGADEIYEAEKKRKSLESPPVIDFGECPCGPECTCSPPPEDLEEPGEEEIEEAGEVEEDEPLAEEPIPNYNLNDFSRAKEFFMTASTKTGISLYDHFSELIRKLLDNRAPENPVDFVEELSLNLKRYRFGMAKDVIQDSYYLSDFMVNDSTNKIKNWKKHALWSLEQQERDGEDATFGGFPNLLRLQYYLEQINLGLPREEMFKVALQMRQISIQYPVSRIRFWGKIFGTKGNYYIFESEIAEGESLDNVWSALSQEKIPDQQDLYNEEMEFDEEEASICVPGAAATFNRAGGAVMDPDIIGAYQQSAGPNANLRSGSQLLGPTATPEANANNNNNNTTNPAGMNCNEYPGEQPMTEEDAKEAARWKEYRDELTTDFPQAAPIEVPPEIPSEEPGHGVNRRVFFVWPETLGRAVVVKSLSDYSDALLLEPPGKPKDEEEPAIAIIHTVTPDQINSSRQIRWYLTGDLNEEVRSYPQFPGREGNYLRALLARITASTAVSPKGYYKTKQPSDEEEEEEEEEEEDVEEEEEDEGSKEDIVYPVKKFRPENIRDLANPQMDLWVHHAAHILRQGRTVWFNVDRLKERKKSDEEEDEEDEEEVDEEEEDQPTGANREIGPKLFSDLEQDTSLDGTKPWTARTSSSVFTEFEVVNARSNLWPGANALCTVKGKVENIYLGDGLKFQGHSYAPFLPEEPQTEYKDGPELTEIVDPSVQEEQEWLAKLQLEEIADIEEKFVDNEEEEEEEEEEDEDEDD